MAVKWMEPPDWWVKYKPLRWLLALLAIYWIFGTLLPRLRTEPATVVTQPAPVAPAPASTIEPADIATAPAIPATVAAPAPTPPAVVPPPKPLEPAAAPVVTPQPTTPVPIKPPTPTAPEPAPAAAAVVPQAQPEEAPAPDPADRYTEVESARVNLINPLRSYASVEAVQDVLGQAGYTAQVSTIKKKLPNDRYPPYRNDTLVIAAYKDAGFAGTLTLEFFNDRLYQAHFVPAQPADYLRWLRNQGLSLPQKRTGRSSLTRGDLRVTTNIDFASSDVGRIMQTTPYVLWEDTRLTQQMKDWGPVR